MCKNYFWPQTDKSHIIFYMLKQNQTLQLDDKWKNRDVLLSFVNK